MGEDNSGIYIPELINGEYYVAPDTDIFILSGVPLDNTYEHTIYWRNLDIMRTEQQQYFLSKTKYGIRKNYYQRVDREWMKISVNAEMLYDCNYIMFRNTAFNEYKWFYAFILDVEYVNNNTSKIRYEIDVMQTWLPGENRDYQMMPCFVERCHSDSDELYENLVPETVVSSDEYLVDDIQEFTMDELSVVTLATEDYVGTNTFGNAKFEPSQSRLSFGAYGKVTVKTWHLNEYSGGDLLLLDEYLNAYVNAGKENSIVSIMVFPSKFRPLTGPPPRPSEFEDYADPARNYPMIISAPNSGDTLGGMGSSFIPRNNKLYSFPYCYIKANNECGTNKIYKWELFDDESRGKFNIVGTYLWQPAVVAYPLKYKNIAKNLDDAIIFTDFVLCPWGSDAYRAWWAQNTVNFGATLAGGIGSVAAIVAGAVSYNPMLIATGAGGAISSAVKIAQSLHEANHLPTEVHGNPKSGLVLPMLKALKIAFTKESLRPEMLRIYDDYFTKYGYAQKKIMIPPLRNRYRWTYVQTIGFEFNGKINDKDTKKIKSVFDTGITFWAYPDEIGNYELDNFPLP